MADSDGKMWEKWLRKLLKDKGGIPKGKIEDALWKDLDGTFKDLTRRLALWEAREIMHFCGNIERGTYGNEDNLKELCKGMTGIIYFMNGIEDLGRPRGGPWMGTKVEQGITDEEIYKRCTVGMVAMLAIYAHHCQFKNVTEYINKYIDVKLGSHGRGGENRKCSNVTIQDLIIGKAAVGTRIKEWIAQDIATVDKITGKGGVRRAGQAVEISKDYCSKKNQPSKLNLQSLDEKDKKNITKLLGLKDNGGSVGPEQRPSQLSPLDVLIKNEYTLSKDDLEKAFDKIVNNGQASLQNGDIDVVVQKLEDEIQQKIGGHDAPPPQRAALAQSSPLNGGPSSNGEGILATLTSSLSDPTTAIPAVAGAMALPAVLSAFILYKKHKHSGSGRSDRRKRSLRREFNDFADDDDSFTLYSRSNLTATSTNSSEYSIPYTTSTTTSR